MAVAFTELTAISDASTSNSTTFNTASLTAVANRLYVIFASTSYTSGITLTNITGGGLGTWNVEAGCSVENSGGNRRMEVAWAWSATPGAAAAIAIQWSGATTGGAWSVYEVTGFNTADPIGTTNKATANGAAALAPTLASATAGSGLLAAARMNAEEVLSVEGGWTAGKSVTHASPSATQRSAYRVATDDLSAGFSWTTSTVGFGSIIEILAASGSTYTLTADSGSYTLTGQTVALKHGYKMIAASGSYALAGNAVTLRRALRLLLDSGSYSITGQAVALNRGYKMIAASGSYALTGQALTLKRALILSLASGSYSLTGNTVALNHGYTLVAASGTYAVTGNAAALRAARLLTAASGSYTLTGSAVAFNRGYILVAASGSYTLTGQDVGLVYTVLGNYTLVMDAGSFAVTGNTVVLRADRKLTADAGAYTLTGNAAGLLYGRRLVLDAGNFSLTGNAVSLLAARYMSLAAGSYTLTGNDVTLAYSAAAASYTLVMDAGVFVLTGLDANLDYQNIGVPVRVAVTQADPYKLGNLYTRFPPRGRLTSRPDLPIDPEYLTTKGK